mmetsp:Transcript_4317/g.12620  ORF Transcript_4317/g.12620 Transcript_4317/m.12620 type:complete len:488 (+) Transcript_4317:1444-2907(+)
MQRRPVEGVEDVDALLPLEQGLELGQVAARGGGEDLVHAVLLAPPPDVLDALRHDARRQRAVHAGLRVGLDGVDDGAAAAAVAGARAPGPHVGGEAGGGEAGGGILGRGHARAAGHGQPRLAPRREPPAGGAARLEAAQRGLGDELLVLGEHLQDLDEAVARQPQAGGSGALVAARRDEVAHAEGEGELAHRRAVVERLLHLLPALGRLRHLLHGARHDEEHAVRRLPLAEEVLLRTELDFAELDGHVVEELLLTALEQRHVVEVLPGHARGDLHLQAVRDAAEEHRHLERVGRLGGEKVLADLLAQVLVDALVLQQALHRLQPRPEVHRLLVRLHDQRGHLHRHVPEEGEVDDHDADAVDDLDHVLGHHVADETVARDGGRDPVEADEVLLPHRRAGLHAVVGVVDEGVRLEVVLDGVPAYAPPGKPIPVVEADEEPPAATHVDDGRQLARELEDLLLRRREPAHAEAVGPLAREEGVGQPQLGQS